MQSRRSYRKVAGFGLLGLVVALGAWLAQGQVAGVRPEGSTQKGPPALASQEQGKVATGWPRRGAADPLVTVVQYSEFECPSCQRVALTLADLVQRYPNDLAVVWKDRPTPVLRPHSLLAAKFARGIYEGRGNEAFWKVHDQLFQDVSRIGEAEFARLGAEFSFDTRRFLAAPPDAFQSILAADAEEASRLGVDATPGVLINGHRVATQDGAFGDLVEKMVNEARALEQGGLTRREVRMKLEAAVLPKTETT